MEGGRPGRSVVLRGDIDGLPVQEDEARAVHSEVEGVMHACGHDVHVAALLGAASRAGVAARGPAGPLRLPLPARPRRRCAGPRRCSRAARSTAMEGSRLVGFHVTSQMPVGLRGAARRASTMSEAHSLRITLTGPGGHGAMPSAQGDVIRATAELVSRLGEVADGLRYEEHRLRVQRRHAPRRHRGQRGADLGPGHGHPAHLHRGPARGGAGPPAGRCATAVGDDQGVHVELEVPEHTPAVVNDADGDRPGGGGGQRRCSAPTRSSACRRSRRATT